MEHIGLTAQFAHPKDILLVSTPAYDWNASLSGLTTSGWSIATAGQGAIPLVSVGNMMLLVQGTFGGHPGDYLAVVSTDSANLTAISLKPGQVGQVLWTKTYQPAPGNNTRAIMDWDLTNGVFVFEDKESCYTTAIA